MIGNKWVKKSLALILAAGMLTAVGCGSQSAENVQNSESVQNSEDEKGSADVTKTEDSGRDKLTVGIQQSSVVADYDTNYYTNWIEEQADVDIEFVLFPQDSSEFQQKLSMLVGSGEKLPDVLMQGPSDVWSYVKDPDERIFLPLDEYLEDEEAMPKYFSYVPEEDRERLVNDYLRQPDGHVYSAFSFMPEYNNENSRKAFINKTWLDALGMDIPTTTDELTEVLRAFKENDLNGNGVADEIPMLGCIDKHARPATFLMNAFIYTDDSRNYLYIEDGKIKAAFTDERWLEGTTYINGLVSEGLIDRISFTQDGTQFNAICNGDEQVVGLLTRASMSNYTNDKNARDFVLLPPLTGPDGACWATYSPTGAGQYYFITKDCENVEAAIRLLDAFYVPESAMIDRYGIPGEQWTTEMTDTTVAMYGDIWEDLEPSWRLLENTWGVMQNGNWQGATPRYNTYDGPYSRVGLGVEPDAIDYKDVENLKCVLYYRDKHPEEIIPSLKYTDEETAEVVELETAIKTYVESSLDQFIVGQLPLSEWDNYLKELDAIGLDRYLELVQTAYDRYKAQ